MPGVAAILLAALLASLPAPVSAQRSSTQLDGTYWKIKTINGEAQGGRLLAFGFYANGRVQLHTACSVFLAGDFRVLLWRLWIDRLDPPAPRLRCSPAEIEQERRAHEVLSNARSFRLQGEGSRIIIEARGGKTLTAER